MVSATDIVERALVRARFFCGWWCHSITLVNAPDGARVTIAWRSDLNNSLSKVSPGSRDMSRVGAHCIGLDWSNPPKGVSAWTWSQLPATIARCAMIADEDARAVARLVGTVDMCRYGREDGEISWLIKPPCGGRRTTATRGR